MNFRFGQYVSGQIYILILRTKCATQNTNVLCTTWTNFLQAKHTYKLLQNMHLPPITSFPLQMKFIKSTPGELDEADGVLEVRPARSSADRRRQTCRTRRPPAAPGTAPFNATTSVGAAISSLKACSHETRILFKIMPDDTKK
jgi:hypothetical protein